MRWISLLLLLAFISTPAFAKGKKPKKITVSFHVEGQQTDNPKMVFPAQAPGSLKYFQRVPAVRTDEILSFTPFPDEDGSFGATFTYNSVGKNRLSAVTNQNRGKWMIAVVDGRPCNVVMINDTVKDGVLVIWKGMKHSEIARLDQMIPRTGESQADWKARKKAIKKSKKK